MSKTKHAFIALLAVSAFLLPGEQLGVKQANAAVGIECVCPIGRLLLAND